MLLTVEGAATRLEGPLLFLRRTLDVGLAGQPGAGHERTIEGVGDRQRPAGHRCRRSDEDGVERCLLSPPQRPVADPREDVVISQVIQPPNGSISKPLQSLDGEDFATQLRQNRRLIAGTCPDFEHALMTGQVKRLGHEGNHVRLRDGLPGANRQRSIFVSRCAQRLGHGEGDQEVGTR